MIDPSTPIIEGDAPSVDSPQLESKARSVWCALRFHRRTRWSKPFARQVVHTSLYITIGGSAGTYTCTEWYQARECLGCGEREEREIKN